MREDIAYLADADHPAAARGQAIEQRRLGRGHGEIAPVGRSLESRCGLAEKRPGDHPPDVQRVDEGAHRPAQLIEPFEPEMPLMGRDLDDGIGRRVADRLACPDVLFAQPRDDLRARCVAVAQDAGNASPGDDLVGERNGKARHGAEGSSPIRTAPEGRLSPSGRRACPCRSILPPPLRGRRIEGGGFR